MFENLKHKWFPGIINRQQKGAISVEYVVIISFLIGLTLVVIVLLVDPTGSVGESLLPGSYNAVSQKIGQFGTLPE